MSRREYKIFLTKEEQREASIRHKFLSESEKAIFETIYEEMIGVQQLVSYQKRDGEKQILVASLGKELDELQNRYVEQGEYLKAYSIDCLSMELLMKFYEIIQKEFQREGYFIKEFLYPGEQIPIETMEFIFQKTKPKEICYNQEFFITPKKSVAMIITLTKEKKEPCKTICEQCSNRECTMRKERRESVQKTYGYQRIFAK